MNGLPIFITYERNWFNMIVIPTTFSLSIYKSFITTNTGGIVYVSEVSLPLLLMEPNIRKCFIPEINPFCLF